ncbi:MAG: hypothetical protein KVP17_001717 [Porospora cf. gigantea B]|nr:MAG: hypothetical protein KVP17_001717 [Porospora cf. gigantea B]
MPFLLVMNPFSHQSEAIHVLFSDGKEDLEPTLVLFPDEMSFLRPKPGDVPRIESVSVENRLKSLQNKESLVQIVKEFRVPKVALFHDLSAASILRQASNGIPLLFVIAHENLLKKYAKDIYTIGGYYRADIQVVLLDLELAGYSGPKIMHILGIETDEVPLVSLVKIKRDRMRFMPETIYRPPFSFFQLSPTDDSGPQEAFNQLTTWLQQYANGQVVEFLKSEPLPDPEDIVPGEPLPIVGSNFLKEVMEDTTKDVLVDFYAPWCGHCTQFEPILIKVAKYSTLIKTLKIAKLDATRNASPGMRVGSFPTVMLFPAKSKDKPHTYAGQRSPEKLLSWINNHASFKFDVQSVVSKYERSRSGTKLMSEQERIRAVLDEL